MAYSPTQPASMLSAVGSWLASGPERAFKGTEAALVTRPSWTLGFTAAVQCLKAAAWAVPRNVPAIRAVTDHSIPGALLPTGVTLHKRVLVAAADPSSGVLHSLERSTDLIHLRKVKEVLAVLAMIQILLASYCRRILTKKAVEQKASFRGAMPM